MLSRRTKGGQHQSRRVMARMAFMYSLVATIYSLSFLSSTSFLHVEVANAFAFKLPKPPRIVKNLINNGWSSSDFEQTAPVIQDWSLDKKLSDNGDIIYSLTGTVTGHPAIADGDAIYTAPIANKYVETALDLLLETETSAKKKFILRGQTTEYSTLITTEFGTRYSLLPPNIKISNAPLVSRGKGTSGANSDGPITKSLSNKEKLTYLEEQIEVVRLLAEREDRLEQKKREEVAEIVRDAGVIVAAALTGAAYFVGDNIPTITEPTAIVNEVSPTIPEEEIRIAKPAKTILPYLEERIKALEEEQQKAKDRESSRKNEYANIKTEIVKEDNGVPDSQEDEENKPLAKLQGEMAKLAKEVTKQPESTEVEVEDDDTKQTSILPSPSSVQEGMASVQEGVTKIFTDIKESIQLPDSESGEVVSDSSESDSGATDTQTLSESLQAQQAKVVDKIGQIAEGLGAIGQDTSNDIGTVVSDLASAGKQVIGNVATTSDGSITNPEEDVGGLAYSALSVFGDEGVMSLYQYFAEALKGVFDNPALEQMWSDLLDLSSKLKEDPRLSVLFKGYSDYSEDDKVKLLAAASFVSVLGVTTAVARSQMYGYTEGADYYENGMESNSWYEYPPDNQFAAGGDWGSYDEGSFDGYSDDGTSSPFPFATSSWDDQSNAYNINGYSQSEAQGWIDTENWTQEQEDGSNVNQNGAAKPYFGNYDGSTSQIEDVDTQKSGFSPFGNSQNEKLEGASASKAGSTPFGAPSKLPTNDQDNKQSETPTKNFSPFGKGSATKATMEKKGDKPDSSSTKTTPFGSSDKNSPFGAPSPKTSSPFGSSSTKEIEKESATSTSKASASPFDGPPSKANSPFGAPKKAEGKDATSSFKAGASPFGGPPSKASSSFGAPKKEEGEDATNSFKAGSSPFGGPPKTETSAPKTSFSPFGSPPTKSSSPFGAPKKGEGEDATSNFKAGASPFGGPPPKASSPFGGTSPNKNSPFGAPSTKKGEGEDATSNFKAGDSSFGTPSKASSPFGGPPKAKTPPFGGSPPKKASFDATSPKQSSPFGGSPKAEASAPKTNFSPFGSPPTKSSSPFGAPKKGEDGDATSNFKAGASPFGGPTPKKDSPFGATTPKGTTPFGKAPKFPTPKQENKEGTSFFTDSSTSFGVPPPKKGSPFGGPTPKKDSPFGAAASKGTTPFGKAPKFPTPKQENTEGTSFFTDSSTSFGVPPPKMGSPFGGPPPKTDSPFGTSSTTSTANTEAEPEIPDFRIKPKMASKPQNDMYERMQEEQAMRLAEYERKNGISSQKDNGTSVNRSEEGSMNSVSTFPSGGRDVAAKKGTAEEKPRTMAKPRVNRENKDQNDKQLSEEELKEKERMKEIQKLAREQARFEIEARGLSKEEKAFQEKDRMERLHKLAREQARFEYDRKRSEAKRGQSTGGTSNKEKTNIGSPGNTSSKPKEKNVENQNRQTLFQTADTPSVEESMQNRVRQEFSNEPTGKRVARQETSDFKVDAREPVRQVRKSAKQEDALMGTKKKANNGPGAFDTARSASNEEKTTRSEKARRQQLENLAEKQAQYKKDRTMSSGARNSGKGMNKGQIIDVEAAEDDSNEDRSSTDEESDVNEVAPSRPRQQDQQNNEVIPKNEKKTLTEKRKQLEIQARQRAKQQFRQNDKFNVQKKETTNGQRIEPDSVKKSPPKVEDTESQDNLSLAYPTQQTGESKQQQDIAEAVMRTDGSYRPSAKALSDTARMMKEVEGFSLSDYNGSKEFINKKSNVSVYVGRTLSVPVRVSTPGSFIEFSITRKASDFDMTILAVPDKGYAFDIKVNILFPTSRNHEGMKIFCILKSRFFFIFHLLASKIPHTENSSLYQVCWEDREHTV